MTFRRLRGDQRGLWPPKFNTVLLCFPETEKLQKYHILFPQDHCNDSTHFHSIIFESIVLDIVSVPSDFVSSHLSRPFECYLCHAVQQVLVPTRKTCSEMHFLDLIWIPVTRCDRKSTSLKSSKTWYPSWCRVHICNSSFIIRDPVSYWQTSFISKKTSFLDWSISLHCNLAVIVPVVKGDSFYSLGTRFIDIITPSHHSIPSPSTSTYLIIHESSSMMIPTILWLTSISIGAVNAGNLYTPCCHKLMIGLSANDNILLSVFP